MFKLGSRGFFSKAKIGALVVHLCCMEINPVLTLEAERVLFHDATTCSIHQCYAKIVSNTPLTVPAVDDCQSPLIATEKRC